MMNEEELKEAKSFRNYLARAIDRKEDSKPERECPKLNPVLEPEKTKLCSPAVKCEAYTSTSLFVFPC